MIFIAFKLHTIDVGNQIPLTISESISTKEFHNALKFQHGSTAYHSIGNMIKLCTMSMEI